MQKMNERNSMENNRTAGTSPHQYRLDAVGGTWKTLKFTVIGAVSLVLSMVIGIYSNSTGSALWGVLSGLLVLVAVGLFLAEIFARAKLDKVADLQVDEANREYFEDAEVIPVFSTKRMFHSTSDKITSQSDAPESVNVPRISFDKEFGFSDAITEFATFAEERGCKLDTDAVRGLFASLASSRILIVRQMSKEAFALLVDVMSEYFGTKALIDRVDSSYTDEHSLLFESEGESKKKNTMLTLEAAQAEGQKVHLLALTDVVASNIPNYFLPFINYAKTPESAHFLSSRTGGEINTYYLPSNLWVILNLAQGERVASLPEALLEVCAIRDISLDVCDRAETFTQVHPVDYSQIKLMVGQSKCAVLESEWKKLDAFADFLNEYLPFAISNKQWIGMERYIAVLNACGAENAAALDEAIAARILPSVLAKAFRADQKIDIAEGLNASFEYDEIAISRRALKELGRSDLHR
ncbi:MAG: hypothetical protein IJW92_09115 [Clostridia bacterium]|nr:hypothetical protein [Clostridia bacterium]